MSRGLARGLAAVDRILTLAESGLLTLLLGGMITLSLLSMALRWAGSGLAAADPLLRYGVLWLGLIGGVAATRSGRHVQIGAVARLLPRAAADLVARGLALITAALTSLISYASARFVLEERAAGTLAYGDIPLWILQTILPLGFALLTLRFLLQVAMGPPEDPYVTPADPEGALQGDDPAAGGPA